MHLGLRGIGGVQGGIEAHVGELVRHLPYPADEIEVIGRAPYRSQAGGAAPGVRWLPALRHQWLEALLHTLIGVAYAAIRRPAVLHIHGIGPNLVTPLARLLGLTVVATHHGNDYEREKWGPIARWALRRGERYAVRRASACIAVSPVNQEALEQRHRATVRYLPNGVPLQDRPPPGHHVARHGLEPGRYIVNVARLVPEKRQLDLIDAFERALLPGVKLLLIGGADHETEHARQVRTRAAANPSVVMTGRISGAPLEELFANAGLFVLPSTLEGLSIALLEAMAYGLDVVVSDLPVYRAMGLPARCLFPARDVSALSARLVGHFAREGGPVADWSDVLAAYRWDRIAMATAAVYDSAIARR